MNETTLTTFRRGLMCAALVGLTALTARPVAATQGETKLNSAPVQVGDGPDGMIANGKPVTKGWVSLFDGKTLNGWLGEKGYWSVQDRAIVGVSPPGTPHHHYMFSAQDYTDFELHVDCKLVGYNSGVCIRIQPKDYDDVPGYQVDMADGYWGCLWDEHHRQKKIVDYPKEEADKIVRKDDWNHYFVRAVGHHITMYLNGVKTADVEDEGGYLSGPLGFQLCHGGNETASFKNLYVKTRFAATDASGKKIAVNAPPAKGTAPALPAVVVP